CRPSRQWCRWASPRPGGAADALDAPGLRWVPVPRRLLRWLAQHGQPGLIATACGVLLRCMRLGPPWTKSYA
ncbi:MAG TPA: hypothetical protein VI542_27130, partial [Candidatus Tectomicrobia bacterium]